MAADEMHLLSLKSVSTGYNSCLVLKGINLFVNEGEIVVLLGTNGMGKSTIMASIIGLVPLQEGAIFFNGHIISGLDTQQIVDYGLSLVPQGRLLFPSLSIIDNLKLGAYRLRSKNKRVELEQSLETVFSLFPILKERRKQRAGTLSGGEQQMLAVGRGLMSRPKLLMLDEPSTGLAPHLVFDLMNTLTKLRAQLGISILLTEQNAQASLKIGDRGYVLGGGCIASQGTCQKLAEDNIVQAIYLGRSYLVD